MSRRFLAFDIETAKQIPGDFSDWRTHRPLGICCAATAEGLNGTVQVWHGADDNGRPAAKMSPTEAGELVGYLAKKSREGFEIVTWNGLQFDFDILAEESQLWEQCRALARAHVDMMFQVVCQLGHMLSLDAAAKGMGLAGKTEGISGLHAPELWARGEFDQVLEYVRQDVRSTLKVAEACERQGATSQLLCPNPSHFGWPVVPRKVSGLLSPKARPKALKPEARPFCAMALKLGRNQSVGPNKQGMPGQIF